MNGSGAARIAVCLPAVLLVSALSAATDNSRRREQGVQETLTRLKSKRLLPAPTRYDAREPGGLPAAAARLHHYVVPGYTR